LSVVANCRYAQDPQSETTTGKDGGHTGQNNSTTDEIPQMLLNQRKLATHARNPKFVCTESDMRSQLRQDWRKPLIYVYYEAGNHCIESDFIGSARKAASSTNAPRR
jgi:hypothetical protein